jgi:hypothetical protein
MKPTDYTVPTPEDVKGLREKMVAVLGAEEWKEWEARIASLLESANLYKERPGVAAYLVARGCFPPEHVVRLVTVADFNLDALTKEQLRLCVDIIMEEQEFTRQLKDGSWKTRAIEETYKAVVEKNRAEMTREGMTHSQRAKAEELALVMYARHDDKQFMTDILNHGGQPEEVHNAAMRLMIGFRQHLEQLWNEGDWRYLDGRNSPQKKSKGF